MLKKMNASVNFKDNDGVEFTDEGKKLAGKLDDFPGCAACRKEDSKSLLLCARCKKEKYCSTDCQKKCWKSHERSCEPV